MVTGGWNIPEIRNYKMVIMSNLQFCLLIGILMSIAIYVGGKICCCHKQSSNIVMIVEVFFLNLSVSMCNTMEIGSAWEFIEVSFRNGAQGIL